MKNDFELQKISSYVDDVFAEEMPQIDTEEHEVDLFDEDIDTLLANAKPESLHDKFLHSHPEQKGTFQQVMKIKTDLENIAMNILNENLAGANRKKEKDCYTAFISSVRFIIENKDSGFLLIKEYESLKKEGAPIDSHLENMLRKHLQSYLTLCESNISLKEPISTETYVLVTLESELQYAASALQCLCMELTNERKMEEKEQAYKLLEAESGEKISGLEETISALKSQLEESKKENRSAEADQLSQELIAAKRTIKAQAKLISGNDKAQKRLKEEIEKTKAESERQKFASDTLTAKVEELTQLMSNPEQQPKFDKNSKIYFVAQAKNSAEQRTLDALLKMYPEATMGVNEGNMVGRDSVVFLTKYIHHHDQFWRCRDSAQSQHLPMFTVTIQNPERISEELDRLVCNGKHDQLLAF